jgi:hypothetical protein
LSGDRVSFSSSSPSSLLFSSSASLNPPPPHSSSSSLLPKPRIVQRCPTRIGTRPCLLWEIIVHCTSTKSNLKFRLPLPTTPELR